MHPSLSGQLSVRASEVNKVCPNQANGESGNVRMYVYVIDWRLDATNTPKLSVSGILGILEAFWEKYR